MEKAFGLRWGSEVIQNLREKRARAEDPSSVVRSSRLEHGVIAALRLRSPEARRDPRPALQGASDMTGISSIRLWATVRHSRALSFMAHISMLKMTIHGNV